MLHNNFKVTFQKFQTFGKFFFFFLLFPSLLFSQAPEIPTILSVTINQSTKKVQLTWQVSDLTNIDGYIIKRMIVDGTGVVSGTYNTIETINSKIIYSYEDVSTAYGTTAKPEIRAEHYRVASFKNDGGSLVYSNMSEPATSMNLQPVKFDLCQNKITIKWNKYVGWSVNEYNIWQTEGAGAVPKLMVTLQSTDSVFVKNDVVANTNYWYYIEARNSDNSKRALSNVQTVFSETPSNPTILNADYGSIENGRVNLNFTYDIGASIKKYKLIRSNSPDVFTDTIAEFPKSKFSISYTDSVDYMQGILYYKLVAINTCNVVALESNLAQTILLSGTEDPSDKNKILLKWNPYNYWRGNVDKYNLFRSADGKTFEFAKTIRSIGDTDTFDDISEFRAANPGIEYVYYMIEANEGATNPFGISAKSHSNIFRIKQETHVVVPTAFSPTSSVPENQTFKPKISVVKDFLMIIYSRWGNKIYETTNFQDGWNGTDATGTFVKKGTYVYFIKITDAEGTVIEKTGQVTLVY